MQQRIDFPIVQGKQKHGPARHTVLGTSLNCLTIQTLAGLYEVSGWSWGPLMLGEEST